MQLAPGRPRDNRNVLDDLFDNHLDNHDDLFDNHLDNHDDNDDSSRADCRDVDLPGSGCRPSCR
ncbi:MAG: hypothetical protein ACLPUG_06530 [Acidimicrobiales bacterium]|jgi:hypothetical protein